MTYCLAMRLDHGLVFVSDTRTNAGVDNVSTYRKLHVFQPTADRVVVLQSAGNLATTQEVLDRIQVDLAITEAGGPAHESLATVDHLFEAALYIGRLGRQVSAEHREALGRIGADATCTFIVSGQIGSGAPDVLLVYPEGNYIRASDDKPFLQIGEAKYGKSILEFGVRPDLDLVTAAKVGLGSMMSTSRANLSVGPPYDVGVYVNDSHRLEHVRLSPGSPLLGELELLWQRHMEAIVAELPTIVVGTAASDVGSVDELLTDDVLPDDVLTDEVLTDDVADGWEESPIGDG